MKGVQSAKGTQLGSILGSEVTCSVALSKSLPLSQRHLPSVKWGHDHSVHVGLAFPGVHFSLCSGVWGTLGAIMKQQMAGGMRTVMSTLAVLRLLKNSPSWLVALAGH